MKHQMHARLDLLARRMSSLSGLQGAYSLALLYLRSLEHRHRLAEKSSRLAQYFFLQRERQ